MLHAQRQASKARNNQFCKCITFPLRESSCFSLRAKNTGAVLDASLLLLRCNLKSTYEGNLARFYVLELRDVACPRVSLESLNLPGEETEIAISRPTMYIISANSLSAWQLESVLIRAVVHLLLHDCSSLLLMMLICLFVKKKRSTYVRASLERRL